MRLKNSFRKAMVGCIKVQKMKITIHNNVWKVKLVDANKKKMNPSKNNINLGLCEFEKCVISIRDGMTRSVTRATVTHELVHAFLFSYGNTVEGEEQMCDFFGVHGDEIMRLTDEIMEGVIDRADNR